MDVWDKILALLLMDGGQDPTSWYVLLALLFSLVLMIAYCGALSVWEARRAHGGHSKGNQNNFNPPVLKIFRNPATFLKTWYNTGKQLLYIL